MFIANALNMGEFLTGTTLLAIGNGIADLVSSSQKHGGDTEMSMNQMYGEQIGFYFQIINFFYNLYMFKELDSLSLSASEESYHVYGRLLRQKNTFYGLVRFM